MRSSFRGREGQYVPRNNSKRASTRKHKIPPYRKRKEERRSSTSGMPSLVRCKEQVIGIRHMPSERCCAERIASRDHPVRCSVCCMRVADRIFFSSDRHRMVQSFRVSSTPSNSIGIGSHFASNTSKTPAFAWLAANDHSSHPLPAPSYPVDLRRGSQQLSVEK